MNNFYRTATTILDYREIEVTPAMARDWLTLNTANRNLKPGQIAAFARDMKAGLWRLTGEAIKFSGDRENPEELLDGQNRLHAVVKADRTVLMSVFFGVASESKSSMDSGTKRTVADNLKIGGSENAAIIAAAASIAIRVREGRLNGGALNMTNAAIEKFIAENTGLEESARVAMRYSRRADVAPSFVCYTHWVLSGIDAQQATEFWMKAAEKVGLTAGDPIIALTNRFAEARRNKEKIRLEAALSAIFRAWNYSRDGKPMKLIKFKSNAEAGGFIPIPEPK